MRAWRLTLIIPTLLISQSVFAFAYNCKSIDGTTKVYLDPDNQVLKIGDVSYVTKKDISNNVISQTEPFKTNDWGMVYIVVSNVPGSMGHISINQVAVEDNSVKASMEAVCEMAS